MSSFAALLDPQILVQLSDRDVDAIESIIDAEIASNPEIQRILKARIDPLTTALQDRGKKGS